MLNFYKPLSGFKKTPWKTEMHADNTPHTHTCDIAAWQVAFSSPQIKLN